jgi:hypothetical protein
MRTKSEIEAELRLVEQKEKEDLEKKRLESNYLNFKKRPSDWVIGKAHCEPTFKDNGWHDPEGQQLPMSVRISGNCGHVYFPTAWITEATNTYFHNVWETKDRNEFQKKLNDLVQSEVERISKSLRSTLEIMGLQSNHYYLSQFPEEKVDEIKKEIWEETVKILDGFPDSDFEGLYRRVNYLKEDGTSESRRELNLSHSNGILMRYIEENRPSLKK